MTMKKTARLLFFLVTSLACIVLLVACGAGKSRKGAATPEQPEEPAAGQSIGYLTFALPTQLRWQQNQDPQLGQGVAEWFLEGHTSQNSPARVVYQKISPARPPDQLAAQVLNPLKQCSDRYVNNFVATSRYPQQLNMEAICSRIGQSGIGLISYVSIYSDASANHVVMAEVRTPPSNRVGEYDEKNAALQKQVEAGNQLAEWLRRTMQSVRVCDVNKRCI